MVPFVVRRKAGKVGAGADQGFQVFFRHPAVQIVPRRENEAPREDGRFLPEFRKTVGTDD